MKGNDDLYKGAGKIWEIAKSHNSKSIIINGHKTIVVRRQVEKTRALPLV